MNTGDAALLVISILVCGYLLYALLMPERFQQMTTNGWLQIGFFLLVIVFITKPLGALMARVFGRGHRVGHRRHPRHRPKGNRQARQFLGGHDALPHVGPAAAVIGRRAGSGVPGGGAKPPSVYNGQPR